MHPVTIVYLFCIYKYFHLKCNVLSHPIIIYSCRTRLSSGVVCTAKIVSLYATVTYRVYAVLLLITI